jgi:hypothetical protein
MSQRLVNAPSFSGRRCCRAEAKNYAALRTLSGLAPATKRSGKSHIVVTRHAMQGSTVLRRYTR